MAAPLPASVMPASLRVTSTALAPIALASAPAAAAISLSVEAALWVTSASSWRLGVISVAPR